MIETVVGALGDLKREFGRGLTASLLVELQLALEPHLRLLGKTNQPGFEVVGRNGKEYQLKQRDPKTLNVDLNSFDFDCLILMLTLQLRLLNLPTHEALPTASQRGTKQPVNLFPTAQSGLSR